MILSSVSCWSLNFPSKEEGKILRTFVIEYTQDVRPEKKIKNKKIKSLLNMQKILRTHHCLLPLYCIITGIPLGTKSISTFVKANVRKENTKTLQQCEHIPRYQIKNILFIKLIIPTMPIHSKTVTN